MSLSWWRGVCGLPGSIPAAELPAALHSCAALACLLASYFVLLPIREEAGISVGTSWLPSLFAVSLLVTLVTSPLASAYLSPRASQSRETTIRRFYLFQAALLALFYVLYEVVATHHTVPVTSVPSSPAQALAASSGDDVHMRILKAVFYVLVNVQNLVNVSALWAQCADVFDPLTGARVYGIISAGATVGQFLGSVAAAQVARMMRGSNLGGSVYVLMLLAAALLMAAAELATGIRCAHNPHISDAKAAPDGGSAGGGRPLSKHKTDFAGEHSIRRRLAAGLTHLSEGYRLICASPYLVAICLHLLLNYVVGSLVYFEKSLVVSLTVSDTSSRAEFFATVNSYSAALILALQLAATSRVLQWLGMTAALSLQPAVCLAGMCCIAAWPHTSTVAAAEVARKVVGYSVSRPARELLFTVVSREEKFKAKLCIDTVVQRMGDTLAAGAFQMVSVWYGAGPAGVAAAACPVCCSWLLVVYSLGKRYTARC